MTTAKMCFFFWHELFKSRFITHHESVYGWDTTLWIAHADKLPAIDLRMTVWQRGHKVSWPSRSTNGRGIVPDVHLGMDINKSIIFQDWIITFVAAVGQRSHPIERKCVPESLFPSWSWLLSPPFHPKKRNRPKPMTPAPSLALASLWQPSR